VGFVRRGNWIGFLAVYSHEHGCDFLEGDEAGCQEDLTEAWEIAERGPMRLHMVDIQLTRARLMF